MAAKYVIDTHALVWYLTDNTRLGPAADAVLSDPASELILPVIALADACWIVERGRTSIPSVSALLAAVDAEPRIALAPLDRATLDSSLTLTTVTEMHDRQIVATALLLAEGGDRVALLTRDENIRASGVVTVVW